MRIPFNNPILNHVMEQRRAFINFAREFGHDFAAQIPCGLPPIMGNRGRHKKGKRVRKAGNGNALCAAPGVLPVQRTTSGKTTGTPPPRIDVLPDGTRALHSQPKPVQKPPAKRRKKGKK